MNGEPNDSDLRAGGVAIELPAATDAGAYFIGTSRTPWRARSECPKRGSADGPICSIVVDARWHAALTDIVQYKAHPGALLDASDAM
jgi:tRNA (adenine37-N6)-methyltransferase